MAKITRTVTPQGRRSINASTNITAGVASRRAPQGGRKNSARSAKYNAIFASLTPEKQEFVRQLRRTHRKMAAITAATNTSNIAARPEFTEMLPLFVQDLIILDVLGSVTMNSRTQLIPYFKVVAEQTKGETQQGDIFSTPFASRLGVDPNFTSRVIRNEVAAAGAGAITTATVLYTPVLPGSVTLEATVSGVSTRYTDDGMGNLIDAGTAAVGTIDYSTGKITFVNALNLGDADTLKASYEFDNETVGPDADGKYGAKQGKLMLVEDEIMLKATAHDLACYWSVFSAFAADKEYGANIADMAKEAAFAELTAEINTNGFLLLKKYAQNNPAFNWDASPVANGAVVPSDYLNMFKIRLDQAASSIYQRTQLSRPNRITVGTNAATYIKKIEGFKAASFSDTVGPYKLGELDEFTIYVEPKYDPNEWVMSCKSNDLRRNSALFGEYMPFADTAAIGLADQSVQQGYATMYAMEMINPATVVSGRILGGFR